MITFQDVSKVYTNHAVALQSVSFHIDKGEFVFLVGPSGAGKSTITKLITCEERPTTGQITVAGKDLSRVRSSQVPYLRRNLGVVYQDFRLLPQKTVFENVAFAMQVVEAPTKLIRSRVPFLLDVVGLGRKAKAFPRQLSGGEQQRVGLARALANDPVLLLCDEPTGNLDPDTSWEIMRLLQQISSSGATVLMSTHAKDVVDKMKKRVIAIDSGRLVRDESRGSYS